VPVARATVTVRDAVPADLPRLLSLFAELRATGAWRMTRFKSDVDGTGVHVTRPIRLEADGSDSGVVAVPGSLTAQGDQSFLAATAIFEHAMTAGDERLLAAVNDAGEIVGMTVLSLETSGPTHDHSLMMSHFLVADGQRRQGVGRALVAAATAWADDLGVEGLGVSVFPSSREANRFYARLGFAPRAVVRVAPVQALKRRLGSEVPAAALDEERGVRRRRLRIGVTGNRAVVGARRNTLG
jgi:GNAT superfamily N-acetyltransferase